MTNSTNSTPHPGLFLLAAAGREFTSMESLEPFYESLETEAHKCNKLAVHGADATRSRQSVDALVGVFKAVRAWKMVPALQEIGKEVEFLDAAPTYIKVIKGLSVGEKLIEAGVNDVFAGQGLAPTEAKVNKCLTTFREAARDHAIRVVELVVKDLEPHIAVLDDHMKHLKMSSSVKYVTDAKKFYEKVANSIEAWSRYLLCCNITPKMVGEIEKLKFVKDQVFIKATHWGVASVLSRGDITDAAKGKHSRAVLRGVTETYLKDPDFKMDDDTMARIGKILAIEDEEEPAAKKRRRN